MGAHQTLRPPTFRRFGRSFFPVRAWAQGSLCVRSQPKVALPRGPVGWPWRISFPTFKGKSSPSGMPTAAPGGFLYRSAASVEEYAFLHLEKVTIFLVFYSTFWRYLSARQTLQKSTNESRSCLPPVVRRLLWAKVGHSALCTAGVGQNRKKSSHV